MNQLSCLPIAICARTLPPPATAAADFIGVDEDSTHRWLCKGQTRHAMVPATEWICSHLALACGLPVPPFGVVELQAQPGVAYFGSQWQGGAKEFLDVMGRISNPSVFERTHAVDLFVHNTDRHPGNYLYLDLAGDIVARVIDFSHALMVMGWPLPALPMANCNTTNHLPALLAQNAAPYQRPDGIMDRIAALPADWMRNTLSNMPDAWLSTAQKDSLCLWWEGSLRTERVIAAKSVLP
jgi:hypothetical protein